MKKTSIIILLSISFLITGCASSCMEYLSATTAARSEKDLKRAEEWGLKALESSGCNPETDASAPYFLATEIYLKQRKYKKMAEMLNIAEKRNPDQLLDRPFKLGNTPITTIEEGVNAYREQEWSAIFNKAVDLINTNQFQLAHDKIEIAISIDPNRVENYSTLAGIHLHNRNNTKVLNVIEKGLEIDEKSSILNLMKADLFVQNEKLKLAEESYLKAIEYSDDPGPIMRKLLFVYIDMGKNEQAIDYSNELLDQYPNDPDLYYNVGVLYQRLTLELFDPTREMFLVTTMDSEVEIINNIYQSFRKSRQYAYNAKDYFLQASDLELDGNISTNDAVSEMRKLMEQIDDLFIPSIRETAKSAGIELE